MDTPKTTPDTLEAGTLATGTLAINIQSYIDKREAYKADNPKERARAVAEAIGLSEAEFVALDLGHRSNEDRVVRLKEAWTDILAEIESLGEVMALTRNEACVHEKVGTYKNFEVHQGAPIALFVDEKIDLRIFLSHWAHGFAVSAPNAMTGKTMHSLQFFNKAGEAVHKIYMREGSNMEAFEALVKKFHAEEQVPLLFDARPEPAPSVLATEKPDTEIDIDGFLAEWRALQDTHDFFGMTKKYGVTRTQALRVAEGEFTRKVSVGAARDLLEKAASTGTPLMVFVGNKGCIQIHSGEVVKLMERGPWYNVMDPGFNLHLNEEHITDAWVVRKPSEDGDVNALEVYDAQGEQIVQFFGKRKPGIPELESWREIAASLS